jgi:hypothetical protein
VSTRRLVSQDGCDRVRRRLVEIKDGPVLGAKMCSVWKHQFSQRTDRKLEPISIVLGVGHDEWRAHCSSVPVGKGYCCANVAPASMSNSANSTNLTGSSSSVSVTPGVNPLSLDFEASDCC